VSADAPTIQPSIASPWLTIAEAAVYCQCSTKTLFRACAAGRLRHATIGGKRSIRVRREWLDAFLDATATPVEVRRG
jgi:excisionase family DNA binding protein